MFGFAKTKPRRTDVAVEVAAKLIGVQLSLSDTRDNHQFEERLGDLYSRGYIWGLCDALIQSAGIEDGNEAWPLFKRAHVELFGKEAGSMIVNQSLGEQNDPLFHKGRALGGQEAFDFLNQKIPPFGLAGYLLEGRHGFLSD